MSQTRRPLVAACASLASVITVVTGLTACGSDTVAPPTKPPTPPVGEVTVTTVATGSATDCTLNPYIIGQGPVAMTVTATGRVPVSVSIFAPDEGAFTKRLARVRILRSGESKAINLRLTLGAYEVECASSGRSSRARLTAI